MSKIFISYAQKDDSIDIDKVEKVLLSHGHEVYRDIGLLEYGDHQKPIIKEKIEESDYVLLILSPYSITRPWVIRELYEAILQEQIRNKKVLLPYVVGKLEYQNIVSNPVLTQWTRTDPFFCIQDTESQEYEDLIKALNTLKNINPFFNQNYSILPIIEDNLNIYRTSELVDWYKNENHKYVQTVNSYFLLGYEKGVNFKHFVLCDVRDRIRVKDIISRYNFSHVTGDGSPDTQGKWKVWFLHKEYPITRDINDPYCNNMEIED